MTTYVDPCKSTQSGKWKVVVSFHMNDMFTLKKDIPQTKISFVNLSLDT